MDKREKAVASINRLITKGLEDSKYVKMREGERPKKGARVIADGKQGEALSSQIIPAAVNYPDAKMKDHTVVEVTHPEGTLTNVDGVGNYGTMVAPKGGFTKHYDSSNMRVHMDDLVAAK